MRVANLFYLGTKELRSLWRDPVMLVLIVIFSFTSSHFLSLNNIVNLLNQNSYFIVAAVGLGILGLGIQLASRPAGGFVLLLGQQAAAGGEEAPLFLSDEPGRRSRSLYAII